MPKNTAKDVTNKSGLVSLDVVDGEITGREGEKKRPVPEHLLTPEAQTLVRTEPGAARKADGRFRREYMVALQKSGRGFVAADWSDSVHDDMHAANKLHMLDAALHAGLHPKGEATFDGEDKDKAQTGSALLVYSVEVVPAGLDEDASATTTARPLLLDMDGASSIVGDDGVPHR